MSDAYDFWARRMPREDVLAIDDFWQRFAEITPRVERYFRGETTGLDVPDAMRAVLGRLSPRLVFDFEPVGDGRIALVLTAELQHANRPLARCAVLRAPRLPRWAVRDARTAAGSIPDAVRAILSRSRSEAMAVEEVRARRGAHRLVELSARGFGDAEFLGDQAGIIFSVLLGERLDQDWLGPSIGRRRPRVNWREAFRGRQAPRNDRWLTEFREASYEVIR